MCNYMPKKKKRGEKQRSGEMNRGKGEKDRVSESGRKICRDFLKGEPNCSSKRLRFSNETIFTFHPLTLSFYFYLHHSRSLSLSLLLQILKLEYKIDLTPKLLSLLIFTSSFKHICTYFSVIRLIVFYNKIINYCENFPHENWKH